MVERTLKKYCAVAIGGWTLIILLLFGWNLYYILKNTKELALIEARALFNKDKAARFWASSHGGVYVPVTEKTPSNPFLAHIPQRDISLPSGKELTLMNPAYMLRQMMTEYEKLYGVKGHITSLIHYRPETAPDEWEVKSLKKFEAGIKEVVEVSQIDAQPYLRLMQPLIANKSCLKCHGIQGYKEGDIRGGVSLSVPLASYYDVQKETIVRQSVAFVAIWILGLLFIGLIRSKLLRLLKS
jgi:hypothetical protein